MITIFVYGVLTSELVNAEKDPAGAIRTRAKEELISADMEVSIYFPEDRCVGVYSQGVRMHLYVSQVPRASDKKKLVKDLETILKENFPPLRNRKGKRTWKVFITKTE